MGGVKWEEKRDAGVKGRVERGVRVER